MIYILGIITGLLISTFILLAVSYFRPQIERTIAQTTSKLKQKGEIFEPNDESLENWVNELPHEN